MSAIGSPQYAAALEAARQLPFTRHYEEGCGCYRCEFAAAAARWAAEYTGWTPERWAAQRTDGSAGENAAYLLAEAASTLAGLAAQARGAR
jgi:hypothetical protein